MSRCSDCGYAYALSPATHAEGGLPIPIPVEISVDARENGVLRRWGYLRAQAYCLMGRSEIDIGPNITQLHECSEIRPYIPGFSAEKHYEMALNEERGQVEADRHEELLKEARKTHKRELWILGGGVTVALIIVTIFGAAIEAGWFSKWFGIDL